MPRYDISTMKNPDSESEEDDIGYVVRNHEATKSEEIRIDVVYKMIRDHAHETCVPIGEYTNHSNISKFLMQINTNN